MKNKAYLEFKSLNNNLYIYDDVTSEILPWNETKSAILKAFERGEKKADIILSNNHCADFVDAVEFVDYWINSKRAFYRGDNFFVSVFNENTLLQDIGNMATKQMILSLTDDCNLRCKYCVYSENYKYTKNKSHNYMSIETAKQAIDYFYNLVKSQFTINPMKKFALTFYGGEPLMNFETLVYATKYAEDKFGDKIYFIMTSNGMLLNKFTIKFLVEHNISICISLDGPAEEHDRLRITVSGEGSFNKIISNLSMIKSLYPDYYKERVSLLSVYDISTDIEKVEKYFEINEKTGKLPRILFANIVSPNNTNYYNQFSENEKEVFLERMARLLKKFQNLKSLDLPTSSYLDGIVGMKFHSILIRRREDDNKDAIPLGGACIPGQKLYIGVDGSIDMCERVNGKNPLGNIYTGLDERVIMEIINEYQKKVLFKCNACPVQKLCNLCYMHFETDSGFESNSKMCARTIEDLKENLSLYTTIFCLKL